MSHIDDARARLTKLRAHFGDKPLPRGTSVEKTIIKLTPDAELGAWIRDKGREGHELAHGTDEEKIARWGAWQLHIDVLRSQYPTYSHNKLCEIASAELGVPISTLRLRTK
jgi:hypothetical protein